MKKTFEFLPIIVSLIVAIFICSFALKKFDSTKETTITSSILTEVVEASQIRSASYIQHGIAKAHIEGKEDGYILYYAIITPTINLQDIKYDVNNDSKTVTVTLPEYDIGVELLEDEEHKFYYHPKKTDEWNGRTVTYICKTDAKQKADENTALKKTAYKSLENTIEALLLPLVSKNGYSLTFESPIAEEV